ncbi:MAG: hypothetical protein AAB325_14165, partial [Pseudomonadota bacterium]
MRDQIHEQLARLRLRGIEAALDAELDRAEREGSPASEVLWRLFTAQEAHRREKSLAYRLTQAKLPWHWPKMARRVAEIVESHGVDVIHARSRVPAMIGFIAWRKVAQKASFRMGGREQTLRRGELRV